MRFIKSYILTCLLILTIALTATAQEKRALFVGISNYPENSGFGKIHGANDFEIVGKILNNQGFNTTKLLNNQATAANIRSEIKNLVTNSVKDSYVYIHFSCHGQPVEDLPPIDEDDLWDESVVAYDAKIKYQSGVYEGENHILDDELFVYFNQIREKIGENGLLCVVIDACHSGTLSRDEIEENDVVRGTKLGFSESGKIFAPRINTKSNFQIEKKSGLGDIVILEACRSYQFNKEVFKDGKYYGSLSYYVSKVIEKQKIAKNLDWILKVRELMSEDGTLTNQNMVYEASF